MQRATRTTHTRRSTYVLSLGLGSPVAVVAVALTCTPTSPNGDRCAQTNPPSPFSYRLSLSVSALRFLWPLLPPPPTVCTNKSPFTILHLHTAPGHPANDRKSGMKQWRRAGEKRQPQLLTIPAAGRLEQSNANESGRALRRLDSHALALAIYLSICAIHAFVDALLREIDPAGCLRRTPGQRTCRRRCSCSPRGRSHQWATRLMVDIQCVCVCVSRASQSSLIERLIVCLDRDHSPPHFEHVCYTCVFTPE